ncbi:hypothetical protein M7I_7552 [Glarea lozoyensis 74030]|uniref:DUF221-domain-containing protein n=1 Tax=Glarea lozoyensis (strain ATCC 74030 / MF5533) TaxID=1104152 RepID=H0EXL5_GLAL7|nr:hypothetical protein M7I_7552 [Glarea lozoyensis 74030]
MSSTNSQTAGSGTSTGSSNSLSSFLSTLVPVAAQAIAFTAVFFLIRSKFKRVYRPRTYLDTLYDGEKSHPLPDKKFGWLSTFKSIPDEHVLNHQSLDGYLYLRFLKILAVICFAGSCLTFPVLFPVNATGGGGQTQLDLLSFSNINDQQKNRYYAHVFCGWIFFAFVMWIVTRETIYFINLRHAYLLAPFNASRISSRTVLFTDVPAEFLNVNKLQEVFAGGVQRAWLATDCGDLEDLVEERDEHAFKLEAAEIKICQVANKRRLKWTKKNDKRLNATASNEERAMPGSQFQKDKDRPTQRLGKIPCIGHKVDTIEYTRSELKRLNPEIERQQYAHQHFDAKILPSVFVEFTSQHTAWTAYRRMTPKKNPKMYPRAVSMTPSDVIWQNLRITKKERIPRKIATNTFLTLMIIFWSIPVAVVGAISNINYLTDIMMKQSGEVTHPAVELKTQNWYMAFQVIQVFLITTFSSGAASVVTQIINEPENLPKASNFYISYIIVQCLGLAAGQLLSIGPLVMITVVGKFLDKSPRKMYNRYINLAGLQWGSLYPRFGNLGIIAITYSIIAPLVMGFAAVGFALVYFAVRYNSMFVVNNNIDTKGLAYAKALQQLMVGIYLSEICLIGLFAINTAPGPIVLMAVFLVGTIIYHIMLRSALGPLTTYLPESMDGKAQADLLHIRHANFDATHSNTPPSEVSQTPLAPTKKSSFLAKLFNPAKFASHAKVQALVPNWEPPHYAHEDADMAYYNPCIARPPPTLWIVQDEMGISAREVRESREVIGISDEFARFEGEKGKVVWDSPEEGGRLTDMPIYEKRVDY